MFMEIDLGTPLRQSYVRNLKIKNTVLKYWPTKLVDGIEVFDRMYMWHGGVPADTAHKEIYKLLNTSVEELQKKNWNHVVSAWFYLKPYHITAPTLSEQDVITYINNNSVLDKEYEVKMQYTQEFSGDVVGSANKVSDKHIINMIEGGYNSLYDPAIIAPTDTELNRRVKATPVYSNSMITYNDTINPCTFVAIMDINNVLFTSTTTIVSKTIEEVSDRSTYNNSAFINNSQDRKYTIKATISYKYKRGIDANDSSVITLIKLVKDKALTLKTDPYSFYKQIEALLHTYNPILPGELLLSYSTISAFHFSTTSGTTYIRKDAASELKPADFSTMLAKSVTTGFDQEKCHGWKCVIGTILMIIVIIVSVVLAIPSGGTSLSAIPAAALFFGALSIYLTLGTLLMAFTAKYLSSNGEYGMAISFGRSLVILSKLAEIVGYIAMVTGIYAMWENFQQQASEEATKQFLKDQGTKNVDKLTLTQMKDALSNTSAVLGSNGLVVPTISNYISAGFQMVKVGTGSVFSNFSKAPGAALNKITGWLNGGMKIYTTWINPIKRPPAGKPQGDTTPPTSIQDIAFKQAEFDSYSFLDVNAVMDQIPADLTTRGLMRETLSRYYIA